jgi:hypothetical protein
MFPPTSFTENVGAVASGNPATAEGAVDSVWTEAGLGGAVLSLHPSARTANTIAAGTLIRPI